MLFSSNSSQMVVLDFTPQVILIVNQEVNLKELLLNTWTNLQPRSILQGCKLVKVDSLFASRKF